MALRVAAIDFLNPAPLMWDFHHPPQRDEFSARYMLHLTKPAQCAQELLEGRADLGLIPIAALTPELRIVPGCTIASLHRVRSIQLIVKKQLPLEQVRTIAADTASRSSVAYVEVLFRHFIGTEPQFTPAAADAVKMLQQADAALLIGDPALLAVERRAEIEAEIGPCVWYDVAEQWNQRTGLPWVAAVWAVRPDALPSGRERSQLIADLNGSRDHGMQHISELVREWSPRIAIQPETIRHYLAHNIHYKLDARCERAIATFRRLAAMAGVLPDLGQLPFLEE